MKKPLIIFVVALIAALAVFKTFFTGHVLQEKVFDFGIFEIKSVQKQGMFFTYWEYGSPKKLMADTYFYPHPRANEDGTVSFNDNVEARIILEPEERKNHWSSELFELMALDESDHGFIRYQGKSHDFYFQKIEKVGMITTFHFQKGDILGSVSVSEDGPARIRIQGVAR